MRLVVLSSWGVFFTFNLFFGFTKSKKFNITITGKITCNFQPAKAVIFLESPRWDVDLDSQLAWPTVNDASFAIYGEWDFKPTEQPNFVLRIWSYCYPHIRSPGADNGEDTQQCAYSVFLYDRTLTWARFDDGIDMAKYSSNYNEWHSHELEYCQKLHRYGMEYFGFAVVANTADGRTEPED